MVHEPSDSDAKREPCRCCHARFLGDRSDVGICARCRELHIARARVEESLRRARDEIIDAHIAHHERAAVRDGFAFADLEPAP